MNESVNFLQITEGVNDNSHNLLIYFMLAMVFFIVYGASFRFTDKQLTSFIGGSAATTIVAILFFASGLIADYIVLIPIIMLITSIIIKLIGGGTD